MATGITFPNGNTIDQHIATMTTRTTDLPILDELTGEHETFDIDSKEFGYKYFDMEEENSKEFLKQFKEIGRWFSQMAITERPKVIKQWREMGSSFDYEWINDHFFKKLYDEEETGEGVFSE